MRFLITLAVCIFLPHVSLAVSSQWGYQGSDGPEYWFKIPGDAECKKGDDQSPINFPKVAKQDPHLFHFDYLPSSIQIQNNGHTIEIPYTPGSFIEFKGKKYEVQQFHFHSPSEHTILGKHADMEMHVVHKSADNHYAVVAVLFNIKKKNADLQPIWSHLPKVNTTATVKKKQIDLNMLLPKSKQAFHYTGSLTTPPCSQSISWFILKEPLPVSKKQVQAFLKQIGKNARPVRPLNNRLIVNINGN